MKRIGGRDRPTDVGARWGKALSVTVLAATAMAASAVGGAWVQATYSQPHVLSVAQEHVISKQASRDSAFIQQNIQLLATKMGDLQASLIAMTGLSQRVAQVAGVSYTDPEIQASLVQPAAAVMDDIAGEQGAPWTAQGLGRQLDWLAQQAAEQKDWLAMLDLVLTKRVGIEAGLPTFMPVNYPYSSSSFGWRRNPVTGRHSMHEGLDFAAPKGAAIYAASGGVVTQASRHNGYGNMVEINHGNGLVTRYAHASTVVVKPGDVIEKGQLIAKVGSTGRSTGPHLHFEVRMAGHPLDPTLFLAVPEPPATNVARALASSEAIPTEVR